MTEQALVLDTARIEGSGAGMDPPPDAVKVGRFYEWHPNVHVPDVLLRQSAPGGEWHLCVGGECMPLSRYLSAADPVRMAPCP